MPLPNWRPLDHIRICIWCGRDFAPNSPVQKTCGCDRPSYICECGSYISGRAKYGAEWGGECDRAEERAIRAMGGVSP